MPYGITIIEIIAALAIGVVSYLAIKSGRLWW